MIAHVARSARIGVARSMLACALALTALALVVAVRHASAGVAPTGVASAPANPGRPIGGGPMLVGHVTWQSAPGQPDPRQQQPITLTLKSASMEVNYPTQTTDASGFFTVSVAGLPNGTYNWRAKGPKFLANSGITNLTGNPTTQVEMGLMRAGDANDNNIVNTIDLNILKATFNKMVSDPGYDARGDFTNDNVADTFDFNVLACNFGNVGSPPIRAGGSLNWANAQGDTRPPLTLMPTAPPNTGQAHKLTYAYVTKFTGSL